MESHLTIVKIVGANEHGKKLALVRCVCGTEKVLLETRVKNGNVKSCGCLRTKLISKFWDSYREPAFWEKVDQRGPDECWNWTGFKKAGPKNPTPYGVAGWEGGHMQAHRLAYQLKKGEIPEGKMVLHKCDNTLCCNPNHLYIGDHARNMQDMVDRGRRKDINAGEKNGRAKLTQEQADEIRVLYTAGKITQDALSVRYGVSQFAISAIVRNKRYVK